MGIERRLDELGRVVIPREYRDQLGLQANDTLTFELRGDELVLKKIQEGCLICGERQLLTAIKGKLICGKCVQKAVDSLRAATHNLS